MKPASSTLQDLITKIFYRNIPSIVRSEVTDEQIEDFALWYNRAQKSKDTLVPGIILTIDEADLTKKFDINGSQEDILGIISYLSSDALDDVDKSKIIMGVLLDINKNKPGVNFSDAQISALRDAALGKAAMATAMAAFNLERMHRNPPNVFPQDIKVALAKMKAVSTAKPKKRSVVGLVGGILANKTADVLDSARKLATGTEKSKSPSEEVYDFLEKKAGWSTINVASGTRLSGPIPHVSIQMENGIRTIPQSTLKEIIGYIFLDNKFFPQISRGVEQKPISKSELITDLKAYPEKYLPVINQFVTTYADKYAKNTIVSMDDVVKQVVIDILAADTNSRHLKAVKDGNQTFNAIKQRPSASSDDSITSPTSTNFLEQMRNVQMQRTGSESSKQSSSKPMPPPLPKQSSSKPTPPPLPKQTSSRNRSDSGSSTESEVNTKAKRPLPPPPPSSPKAANKKIPPRPTNYPKR